ncbi:hypothetical protein SAMD00019534_033310 [Acytostelium subglobosum LB1]|uniref:hypothetical protein n=1 Tax=Acytostelium subglobosum LB1 TaxID=1410327 RepID=UPI0006448719|nr:hypothetical protein SAMD00019534_033310 [Acytostelium subglobosum LB1]GAM20156.1 hypothetical protein SAMD00019534_033310 [Acytostelium subglobosum LB1]|eukprot:XP_012759677.1 hypothetical protein SAMD00019534_033310 [Acytostelium subglobosum LB1]
MAAPSDLTKVYALWHCGADGCMWNEAVDNSYFDWIVNRGDGQPTANLIIFSFLNPVNVLSSGVQAVPAGLTPSMIQYLQSNGISVMFSIGGEEWSSEWDQALGQDPVTLGKNAAAIAQQFGVGIEIDYESEQSTPLLDQFVKAYRSVLPMDNSTSATDSSLLTVDTGSGTGYLTSVSQWASTWLEEGLINWINAMVAGGPYGSIGEATQYWDEHLQGTSWANIPPMNPEHLVVSLYSCDGSANCNAYPGSVLQGAVGWVQQQNTRGISFWVGGCVSPTVCCNNCPGIQQGSEALISN